jgi:hypothetical protein
MTRHRRPRPLARRASVTVVMPCYNYGHYLPRALGSVLSQENVDVDVILIDDASPDGSASVVRALASADTRVRPILHERNRGHIATYNEGLEQATGDYVVLLSADDALPPGALARATALMEAEPSVGFVYGYPMVFSDELPPASTKVRSWSVWTGRDWIGRRCRRGENCTFSPEVVMRTSLQHAIGGYDPKLPHSGDFEMWMRAAAFADVGRVNGPAQAYYRVHQQSMQRTVYAGRMTDLQGRLDAFRSVLVGPDPPLSDGDELYATARRSLSRAAVAYARDAYEHERTQQEPVDEYLAFAEQVWPAIRDSRGWRRVERQAAARQLRRGAAWKCRRLAEDLDARVRWRRWRRYGE